MKVTYARFKTSVRVSTKEYTFVNAINDKMDLKAEQAFLVAEKNGQKSYIPFSNVAYVQLEAPKAEETEDPAVAKPVKK